MNIKLMSAGSQQLAEAEDKQLRLELGVDLLRALGLSNEHRVKAAEMPNAKRKRTTVAVSQAPTQDSADGVSDDDGGSDQRTKGARPVTARKEARRERVRQESPATSITESTAATASTRGSRFREATRRKEMEEMETPTESDMATYSYFYDFEEAELRNLIKCEKRLIAIAEGFGTKESKINAHARMRVLSDALRRVNKPRTDIEASGTGGDVSSPGLATEQMRGS